MNTLESYRDIKLPQEIKRLNDLEQFVLSSASAIVFSVDIDYYGIIN